MKSKSAACAGMWGYSYIDYGINLIPTNSSSRIEKSVLGDADCWMFMPPGGGGGGGVAGRSTVIMALLFSRFVALGGMPLQL